MYKHNKTNQYNELMMYECIKELWGFELLNEKGLNTERSDEDLISEKM